MNTHLNDQTCKVPSRGEMGVIIAAAHPGGRKHDIATLITAQELRVVHQHTGAQLHNHIQVIVSRE